MHFKQLKEMQSSKLGMRKVYHFSIEGARKGQLFCEKKIYKRVMGWTPGRSLPV